MEAYEKIGYSCIKLRTAVLLVLFFETCIASAESVFINPCNKQTTLGQDIHGGKLYYSQGPETSGHVPCVMELITDPGYVIRYKFDHLNLDNACTDGRRYCGCNNSLTVSSTHNGVAETKQYCSGKNVDTHLYAESVGNRLSFNVTKTSGSFVGLQIRVYTLKYAQNKGCGFEETLCTNVCVHRSLSCGPDRVEYCNTQDDVCTDIKTSGTNGGLIAGVVCGMFAFLIIIIIVTMCLRAENSLLTKVCCKRQPQSNSNRANAIFTVQLATRGVLSNRNGSDNQAYTEDGEPIDRVTFQPPPEYSSLEHIDRAGRGSEPKDSTDGDLPPSYEDAVQHREQYKITINEGVNA